MRLAVREDLGGWGATLPGVARAAGISIERPFVLLCGPNGSGKTALLRMARAAMGLMGERGGRIVAEALAGPPAPDTCRGDPGRLAAFVDGFGGRQLCREVPGVLDAAALGWSGQRGFLYDSRSDGRLAAARGFEHEIGYSLSRAVGSGGLSHGQFLDAGWREALDFALGLAPARDPYDGNEVPAARAAAFRAACPSGRRPTERWLFLDEPETALDAEALTAGLCALLGAAAPGRLRVFCASHAPVFAAGLGNHPAVQVLDLAGDWYAVQRRALALAADPRAATVLGRRVAADMARRAAAERRRAERAASAELTRALRGLGVGALGLLDALYAREGHRGRHGDVIPGLQDARARAALERRGLIRSSGLRDREAALTQLGVAAGRRRAENAAA